MSRYKIWDKQENIYTPRGEMLTAAQWLERYAWANAPGAKMVISGGVINGGCALEFEAMKQQYARMGCTFTEGMTDAEVLAAIEAFEDAPVEVGVSAEERIAAALEYQNLASL